MLFDYFKRNPVEDFSVLSYARYLRVVFDQCLKIPVNDLVKSKSTHINVNSSYGFQYDYEPRFDRWA